MGDVLLGIPSSGLHSNGFSLARKIIGLTGLSYADPCPWAAHTSSCSLSSSSSSITLGEALLTPTRLYVKTLLPAIRTGRIKALSHITGGGFVDNLPRVFPTGLGCTIDLARWTLPPVFKFLMQHGNVAPREMCRTFNCGFGMVLVVGREDVDAVRDVLVLDGGEKGVCEIGEIVQGAGVELKNVDTWL